MAAIAPREAPMKACTLKNMPVGIADGSKLSNVRSVLFELPGLLVKTLPRRGAGVPFVRITRNDVLLSGVVLALRRAYFLIASSSSTTRTCGVGSATGHRSDAAGMLLDGPTSAVASYRSTLFRR